MAITPSLEMRGGLARFLKDCPADAKSPLDGEVVLSILLTRAFPAAFRPRRPPRPAWMGSLRERAASEYPDFADGRIEL
jgi:hypothetical protein